MNSRKTHKVIGLILILPMLGWICTGFVFLIKPGYSGAYEQLTLKTYPLEKAFTLPYSENWEEVKLIRTILGYHLLVKADGISKHLDPTSFKSKKTPTDLQLKLLLSDALSENKARYGKLVSINGEYANTSNDVEIKFDWKTLRLSQKGQDTELINILYKIHYLQWSPYKIVNKLLGGIGLFLLITLTVLGIIIYTAKKT